MMSVDGEGQDARNQRLRANLDTMPSEVMDAIAFYLAISSPGPRKDPVGSNAPPEDLQSRAIFDKWALDASSEITRFLPLQGRRLSDPLDTAVPGAPAPSRAVQNLANDADAITDHFAEEPPAYATPPAQLVSLLLSCRHAYDLLNCEASPRLYSRIFKTKFDHRAIERRFGKQAIDPRNLTVELKKRCVLLKRIKATVTERKIRRMGLSLEESQQEVEENLWLAYLMMLENDGKNVAQLRWAQIDSYLTLHYVQELLESVINFGYPPDSVDRALALHLQYLLFGSAHLRKEDADVSEEKMFTLRPYVFAAHKFDAYLAPWTLRKLPTGSGEIPRILPGMISEDGVGISPLLDHPFLADLSFHSRKCRIEYCGQKVTLIPPILSHAAVSIFFQRVELDPAAMGLSHLSSDEREENEGTGGWQLAQVFQGMSGAEPANTPEERADRRRKRRILHDPSFLRSVHHDKDFARLIACIDPRSSIGLKPSFHAGDFEGAWEGRFSFFDFDSYRDMLAGLMSSLYEGPFGEQPQVWKLTERMVKLGEKDCKGGRGSILGAGYIGSQEEEEEEEAFIASRPEKKSFDGLGERSTDGAQKLKLRRMERKERDLAGTSFGSPAAWTWNRSTRSRRRMDDSDDLSFGNDELTTQQEEEFADDPDKFELRLAGSGHSAWGRFKLRGRIRSWDGMMIMKKEYTPDGRGRWLYRGYALAGGKLVGRWRDTFTPENMSGYEGCFCLYKRGAET